MRAADLGSSTSQTALSIVFRVAWAAQFGYIRTAILPPQIAVTPRALISIFLCSQIISLPAQLSK